ncbi:MAG: ABC transporter substrate-binding protein [gamma proteobacterium endosymbiont of Lamellibrachia anaximandri]|nr:ABC transporter substrate-binding protein [gamma proteobacterium endosymbiont of Lamellibrachia anaximandri]MBL3532379.1 ABC transporter substrate-binding protein [gamma proteobacterium endosymbiont of Lamellibrachia anaximandri]
MPGIRGFILIWLMLAAGLSWGDGRPPSRVVSINLCTDQLLLMLADADQIASVSYLSLQPESSFVAGEAIRYPTNHARPEELLALDPDLILTVEFTDRRLLGLLDKLGYRVARLPMPTSISAIESNIRQLAELLGQPARGTALIHKMRSALSQIPPQPANQRPKALFYQPRGYTSGSGTLQNEALALAGWSNLAAEKGIHGYNSIDLESLLLGQPDQIFSSTYTGETRSLAQRQLRHPALHHITHNRPIIEIPFKYWICGGPMITDAVAELHAALPNKP